MGEVDTLCSGLPGCCCGPGQEGRRDSGPRKRDWSWRGRGSITAELGGVLEAMLCACLDLLLTSSGCRWGEKERVPRSLFFCHTLPTRVKSSTLIKQTHAQQMTSSQVVFGFTRQLCMSATDIQHSHRLPKHVLHTHLSASQNDLAETGIMSADFLVLCKALTHVTLPGSTSTTHTSSI